MTGMDERATRDELESLLDAFGADPARWPASRKPRALALLASDDGARRRLAQARALDAVLARHPKPDAQGLGRLADRIVAEAQARAPKRSSSADLQQPAAGARIIRLDARRTARAPAAVQPARARWPWRTATALAASLAIGVAIGLADLAPTRELGLTTVAEAGPGDAEVVLSALQNDRFSALDEEQI